MKNTTKVFATIALVLGSFLNSNAQLFTPSLDTLTSCMGNIGLSVTGFPNYNSNWQVLWSTGATTHNINYTFYAGGTFKVWVRATYNGQSTTDTFTFIILEPPTTPIISSLSSETACADSITITANPQPGFNFEWYKGDNLNVWQLIPGATSNTYTASSTERYWVRVSIPTHWECALWNDTSIVVSGTPKPFMNDTTFCQTTGASYTVSDNVNNGNYTYTWLQGNAIVNPNQVQNTTNIVNIKNENNCSINDTMMVKVNPLPTPNFTNDITTCGEFVTLKDLSPNANYDYVWTENNNILSNTDSLSVNYTGTFKVETTNEYGCAVNDTLYVLASESVKVSGYNAIPNISINPKSFQFYALGTSNVTDYLWDFGDGMTSTLESPVHIFADDMNSSLITLTVSNDTLTGDCARETISLNMDVSGTTSIGDLNEEYTMNVYPNPSNNIVNVKVGKGNIVNVIVTDIVGKVVYSSNANASNLSMDLSAISSGLYIVKATVKDGSNEGTVTRKIVKQ